MTLIKNGVGHVPLSRKITATGRDVTARDLLSIQGDHDNVVFKLNGELTEGDGSDSSQAGNHRAQWKTIIFAAADTEVTVPHDLGVVPLGYDVRRLSAAAIIYDSNPGGWSRDYIYLKASAPCTVKLKIHA